MNQERVYPPGEDGLENMAAKAAFVPQPEGEEQVGDDLTGFDFLNFVQQAEQASNTSYIRALQKQWRRGYQASRNEHFDGSKYTTKDFEHRSKLFRPKTRTAIRRDKASVAASLFNSIDAIQCDPGNEADPQQKAAAAVIKELVNYRFDRTSRRAAIPWFLVSMGARDDALHTGVCISKQHWRMELKLTGEEEVPVEDEMGVPMIDPATNMPMMEVRKVYRPILDRPDCKLCPPENVIIDSAADWTDPAQSAAYLILKWPMRLSEIEANAKDPLHPWKAIPREKLKNYRSGGRAEDASVRTARSGDGADRYDKTQTGSDPEWDVFWVYESYVRVKGQDLVFFSIEGREYLTDPEPVEDVHPAFDGERPIVIGYGSVEAHKIFPMSAVESWQQLQQETNDITNLALDGMKQNIFPVAKVVRGRNVDLNVLKRRGPSTSVLVQNENDVTWDRPSDVPASVGHLIERINVDFDTLAGQFDAGSVQTNRKLNETVGGMKLLSGAANAVQEFDQRVWVETWVEPVVGQIVKLEQYYESDPIILGLCGERAKLVEKFGVSDISDHLLNQQVTVKVNVGMGNGDPEQRIQKFASAAQVAVPLLKDHPKFQSGEYELDVDAIMDEVFGAVGYRDGGHRFIVKNEPKEEDQGPPPDVMAEIQKTLAEIKKIAADTEKAKAETEQTRVETMLAQFSARLDAMGLARDVRNDQAANQQRQVDNSFRAADHVGKREDAKAKNEAQQAKAAAKPAPKAAKPAPAPAPEPQKESPGIEDVQFIRGKDGSIEGAVFTTKDGQQHKARFIKEGGKIVGARLEGQPQQGGNPAANGRAAPQGIPPGLMELLGSQMTAGR